MMTKRQQRWMRMWLGMALGLSCLASPARGVPQVILDTDYRSDVDDVGALATLHAFENMGWARILGVVATTTGPHVVAAIDAVNTFYGRTNIPVGLIQEDSRFNTTLGDDDYAPLLADRGRFRSVRTNEDAPESTALYRRLLHGAEDRSVTIVVVGAQTAVHRLLRSGSRHGGDDIALTGKELIERKVRELVLMGGHFTDPGFAEFNITLDVVAAQEIAGSWPSPIMYSGFERGVGVLTGAALRDPVRHPVALAYEAYRGSGGAGVIGNRNSWDQTAVVYAVVGTTYMGRALWHKSEAHRVGFTDEGRTLKTADPGSERYFLKAAMSDADLAAWISGWMIRPPGGAGK